MAAIPLFPALPGTLTLLLIAVVGAARVTVTSVRKCDTSVECTPIEFCIDGRCARCAGEGALCAFTDDQTVRSGCCEGSDCRDGLCARRCSEHGDCSDGEICHNGACKRRQAIRNEPCGDSAPCSSGFVCFQGRCLDSCASLGDCLPNHTCSNFICMENKPNSAAMHNPTHFQTLLESKNSVVIVHPDADAAWDEGSGEGVATFHKGGESDSMKYILLGVFFLFLCVNCMGLLFCYGYTRYKQMHATDEAEALVQ